MRKRTIVVLAIYVLVLLFGSLYVVNTIDVATSRLDDLIVLHQVEILRDHYLIEVGRVQADLMNQDATDSTSFEAFFSNARAMDQIVRTCFDCHHEGLVEENIRDLKQETDTYKESLSRVLTIRASPERLAEERDTALRIGEELTRRVGEMVATTGARLEASTQQTLDEIDDSKRALYLLVGIAPLVSAGLGWVIVSGLTNPLRVLLDSTNKLKQGNLDHRVIGLRHEFGEVGRAFNEMAASLKEQMTKMQRAEQMAVVGELAAGLAHEIKNPLAGIKVAMNVLEDEANLAAEDQAVVRKVAGEVARLDSLMKSFLNFAKPPRPQLVPVDVNAVMNASLALHGSERATSPEEVKSIRIVKELGTLPSTMADAMHLQQVFLNLLINAKDAMPEGGTLRVRTSLEDEESTIKIEVADTGSGIEPEFADKIFQPFFTTKAGGTGLGLPICRQLIEQHGGSISAAANSDGGTSFAIRLPLLRDEREA